MLVRLIYYSSVGNIKSLSDIQQILEKSQINNAKKSISGMLYFDDNYFIQVLEGDRKLVSDLMFKISKDERHTDIVIVNITEINQRMFSKWSMLSAAGVKMDKDTLMQFSANGTFNPNQLSQGNFDAFVGYVYSQINK
ncbi:MAG: BLUF domain-containing protein [Breznakibacter sp.]|jgi:hypothetical protein|nr:BLUF domain-containing protein [Breznakibacter sp.]